MIRLCAQAFRACWKVELLFFSYQARLDAIHGVVGRPPVRGILFVSSYLECTCLHNTSSHLVDECADSWISMCELRHGASHLGKHLVGCQAYAEQILRWDSNDVDPARILKKNRDVKSAPPSIPTRTPNAHTKSIISPQPNLAKIYHLPHYTPLTLSKNLK